MTLRIENFKITENEEYYLRLEYESSVKKVSLYINDELLLMTESDILYNDVGHIGIYSLSTLLKLDGIQCIESLP